jgi:TonB-linked SusC/RagA family outer membrane protein
MENYSEFFRGFVRKRIKVLRIMKLTLMLLIVGALQLSANVYSQNGRINVNVEEMELADLLWELQESSGIVFAYRTSDLEGMDPVTANFEGATITEILDEVLEDTHLDYKMDKEVVVIVKREIIPEITTEDQQEKKIIKGKVTDDQGIPLPGVSVVIKGTNIGVATDIDGNYTLTLEQEEAVLVFSFVGMTPQEIAYTGQFMLDVTLAMDTEKMAEVVVTGYQTISKERVTGAYNLIDKKELEKSTSDITSRLITSLPSMQLVSDRLGNESLQIRGQSSLGTKGSPLIVVDGFPVSIGLSDINPNEIESITILKDAAAASIWGARSGNGVVVINTKSAKNRELRIEYEGTTTRSGNVDIDYYLNRANSADQLQYEKLAFDNNLFGAGLTNGSFGDAAYNGMSAGLTYMNEHKLGYLTDLELASHLSTLSNVNNSDEIKKHFFRRAFSSRHNLNISGGSENMDHFVNVMYEHGKAVTKGSDSKKFNLSYRTNVKINKNINFKLSGSTRYTKDENASNQFLDAKRLSSYDTFQDSDGNYFDVPQFGDHYKPAIERWASVNPDKKFAYNWINNPIQNLKSGQSERKSLSLRLQAALAVKIIDGLDIISSLQVEKIKNEHETFHSDDHYYVRNLVNTSSSFETMPWGTQVLKQNIPNGAIIKSNNDETNTFTFRNQLNFRKTINKHSLVFLAGTEMRKIKNESTIDPTVFGYNERTNIASTLLNGGGFYTDWMGRPQFSGFESHLVPNFGYRKDVYVSYYSNVSYSFDDKYTISGSYRTDASNLITDDPKKRYSPFWSVGLNWNIHRENFVTGMDWLNRLVLRGSYGVNGNVSTATSYKPLISLISDTFYLNGRNTATISNFGNPELGWEKTRTFNIGVDFAVLGGKINGSIDAYKKKGDDLLTATSLPSVYGTTEAEFNSASMVNKGIDLSLSTKQLIAKTVGVGCTVNVSYNKNEITRLNRSNYTISNLLGRGSGAYAEGHNANSIWAYKYGGMKNFGTNDNPNNQPSYLIGDEQKSFSDRSSLDARKIAVNKGVSIAPWVASMNLDFDYKNFNLSFIFIGKFGHKFMRTGFNYTDYSAVTNVNSKYKSVKNADGSKEIPVTADDYSNYYLRSEYAPNMDYLVTDASHIRFREVRLSWIVPTDKLSRFGVNGASLFLQVNNVSTWKFNSYGEDPEYRLGSIKPVTSSLLGLKVNF